MIDLSVPPGIHLPHMPEEYRGLGVGVLDGPVGRICQDARAARIYDGASEVHRMTIARECPKLAMQGEPTVRATGDLA